MSTDPTKSQAMLRSLYPTFSDEELAALEEAYDRYIDFCLEVLERVESDPAVYAEFCALTGYREPSTLKPKPEPNERTGVDKT